MRAPLVVTATAGLFAAAGARYDEPSHLTLVSVYICVLLLCATTDLLAYRVPNIVTYPAIASAVAGGAFEPDAGLIDVLLGGVVAGGVLFLPALASRGAGMGMGDVKLALFVGLALGLSHVALALVAMALLGGVTAALLLVTRLRRRHEPIPYAPFIAAGGLVALLWQGAAFVDLA
jgi:leader peptidase (prepilin peptidase)/N-methyltransferase